MDGAGRLGLDGDWPALSGAGRLGLERDGDDTLVLNGRLGLDND